MKSAAVLGQLCWPQLADRTVTLVVPLGAVEQHGPHLPLDTDTRIAAAVARAAVDAAQPGPDDSPTADSPTDDAPAVGPESVLTVLAPELGYGASGEHEGFPGTVSLGLEALQLVLVEYGRSACRWASRVVFVNGHGGNARALVSAVRLLRQEGRDVAWFPCAAPDGDAHAGYTETSVLLYLSPSDVRVEHAVAGNGAPIETLLPVLRSGGVAAASMNGVLGDPADADGEVGARLVARMVDDLVAALQTWTVDDMGRVR